MNQTIDRPITRSEDDSLNRADFTEHLCRALVDQNGEHAKATNYVVGLTGEWGSGKSSILNLVAEKLSESSKAIIVQFNPWVFSSAEELISGFFEELGAQLFQRKEKSIRKLFGYLRKYRSGIIATTKIVSLVDPTGTLAKATDSVVDDWKPSSLNDLKKQIEESIKELNIAIVVLIDELDRVEDDEVRAVAKLIKAVSDLKGISYLVAYDPKRVAQALNHGKGDDGHKNGYAYLEKIIQMNVPLRTLDKREKKKLLETALKAKKYDLSQHQAEGAEELEEILFTLLKTPRDFKRLIENFAILDNMVHGLVHTLDVLGYTALVVKRPDLRSEIENNPKGFCSPPDPGSRLANGGRQTIPEKRKLALNIGDTATSSLTAEEFNLIFWLFPNFLQNPQNLRFNGIHNEMNLRRLLYLGTPPGDWSIKELRELYTSEPKTITGRICEILSDRDRGLSFVERLSQNLPTLPPENDATFWPALSSALLRNGPWDEKVEFAGEITNFIQGVFVTKNKDADSIKERRRAIIDILVSTNDILILSQILNTNVLYFKNKTMIDSRYNGYFSLYNEDDLNKMYDKLIKICEEYISNGKFLKHSTNSLPYNIVIAREKDKYPFKDTFMEQFKDDTDNLVSYCCLFVPTDRVIGDPFSGAEIKWNEVIDAGPMLAHIKNYQEQGKFDQESDWAKARVEKFKTALENILA